MIYHEEILQDATTVYLPLEEASGTTADDESGNGLDGTYAGSGVTYRGFGPLVDRVSYGATFNGSAGRVSRALSGANTPDFPFVLEAWVRPGSATPTQNSVVASVRGDADEEYAAIAVGSGNRWTATVLNATGPVVALATADTAITGGWQHLVLRAPAIGQLYFYVDGRLAGSDVSNAPGFGGDSGYTLGIGYNALSANYLAGSVSRVAYYNADVSARRTAAHYRAGVRSAAYQAVASLLGADAEVLALTLGQIFADQLPDDTQLPAVRYVVLADLPHNRLSGADHFTAEVQVDAYASRGDENTAWQIAGAAHAALKRATLAQSRYPRIPSITSGRPQPMHEAGFSRITSRYRLHGTAA